MDRMMASVERVVRLAVQRRMDQVPGRSGHRRLHASATRGAAAPRLVDALQKAAVPKDKDWFATSSASRVARDRGRVTQDRTGIDYRPEDIALTTGAFGGLVVTIRALADGATESSSCRRRVFYELMIASAGAHCRPRPSRCTGLRPRSRGGRRCHHPRTRGPCRQQPEQPDRPDLS